MFIAACTPSGCTGSATSQAAVTTVSIAPPTARVAAGNTQQFAATVRSAIDTTVVWSVDEGSAAGSVSTTGLYQAPTTAGVYHVRVTLRADASQSAAATVTVTVGGPIGGFPVVMSSNHRYLQNQSGVPFPILGRTAWFVISLSPSDRSTFLSDTVAREYNAIEMLVIDHDARGNNPPRNGNGDLPFTRRLDGGTWNGSLNYGTIDSEAPDFSTPNEAYWSFVDTFLSDCEAQGLLVFFFPAYTGYTGGAQGWIYEMVANGPTKMSQYGAFLAARYKNQGNIVWMMGGDMGTGSNPYTPEQSAVEGALINGLKSVTGQSSTMFSAEWSSNSICTDQGTFASHCTLQGAYSWIGQVSTYARNGYAYSPTLPTFLLEEPYDEEGPDGNGVNPNAIQPVRRFQWWGWLSGIAGYISGNGYVWPFRSGWQSHLGTQGAQDMARLNAFIKSIPWYELIPSGLAGMKTLVTSGGSSPGATDYVAAAATPGGTLLVAYVGPAHTGSFTIDVTAMSGAVVRARWFNPTTGAYTLIGSFPNTGSQVFTPPGNNGSGFADWVLLVDLG